MNRNRERKQGEVRAGVGREKAVRLKKFKGNVERERWRGK